MSRYILAFVTLFLLSACAQKTVTTPKVENAYLKPVVKPKNVILMIGDGMGLTQITSGLYMNGNKLNLERIKNIGFHKCYASNNLITDSAAGATAFASGVKTYNGAIGVDPDTLAVTTILEEAEAKGMATGMVATSTIVHATPASFIAHVPQRKQYEEIATFFLETEIDFFVGGGKKYFDRRKDGRNLIEELREKNYFVSDYFTKEFDEILYAGKKNFAYFASDGDPLPVSQGRDYLIPATEYGLSFLNNRSPNGFFYMIEGSQIDWGGHANNANYIITEMIEFDNAIGRVLDFAEKDGNTLVIITADHETGGFAINKGSKMDSLVTAFTSDYHTADLIPVFAFGPGAEAFNGFYENTAIYDKMKKSLEFDKP